MFPKYEEVITPLLVELVRRGGRSAPSDLDERGRTIYEALADHFNLTPEERSRRTDDGEQRPFWERMVRFARQRLYDRRFPDRAGPRRVAAHSAVGALSLRLAAPHTRCQARGLQGVSSF